VADEVGHGAETFALSSNFEGMLLVTAEADVELAVALPFARWGGRGLAAFATAAAWAAMAAVTHSPAVGPSASTHGSSTDEPTYTPSSASCSTV